MTQEVRTILQTVKDLCTRSSRWTNNFTINHFVDIFKGSKIKKVMTNGTVAFWLFQSIRNTLIENLMIIKVFFFIYIVCVHNAHVPSLVSNWRNLLKVCWITSKCLLGMRTKCQEGDKDCKFIISAAPLIYYHN